MKHLRFNSALLGLFVFGYGCGSESPSSVPPVPVGLDWAAMASKIVERAYVLPGEGVLLAVKGDRFRELVPHLRSEIAETGANDLGTHDVDSGALSDEQYRQLLREVDLMVILPGPVATDGLYRVMQGILSEGQKRTIHFHWEGAIPLPGRLVPDPAIVDETYQKALLETDYESVARAQERFEAALRSGRTRVTTPLGTDLSFEVGDRPVSRQDGDASNKRAESARILIDREVELPCGAIRVAPMEVSVNGVVVFPPAEWNGRAASSVSLRFEKGRIVEVQALDETIEAVRAELERGGDAAHSLREFALGFNPLLAVPDNDPWVPYYGYGAGVVRLSLGDNSELGGIVRGPYVRWNFLTDATVEVAGEVWVESGRLVR